MKRARLSTVLVGALLVLSLALVVQRGHDRSGAVRPTSYAKAAAANYKVLSPRRSRQLLAYAQGLYTCLRTHGVAVGSPRASRIRIELALPKEAQRSVVLAEGLACGETLGGPPPGASQQFRPAAHAILVYLPKYCLLDPKVDRGAASS